MVKGNIRTVSVLGSTGSIGCNTIDLISRNPERYTVSALTANTSVALLAEQAKTFRPEIAVIADDSLYPELKSALEGTGIVAGSGASGILEAADVASDFVMAGIVGAAGLEPTLKAVQRGATVGLANKECLVSAGDIFLKEVKKHDASLLPVDSEHNAIFQIFDFDNPATVLKIILTASGGPFRTSTLENMKRVSREQALAHPNWDMGAKISIDSATMMNKGLELIEAYYLFPVAIDQIEVLVHPQSIIHSLVEYVDGSVLAQLGTPDMRTPISYALAWPGRIKSPSARLNLSEISTLTFETPDEERFPSLRLARQSVQAGGSAPCILNAANEIAVASFLEGKIDFLDIARIVDEILTGCDVGVLDSLDDVLALDSKIRTQAHALIISKFVDR